MRHTVIYIPGLADYATGALQAKVLSLFLKVFGLNVHYQPMNWSDKLPFSQKFDSILAEIDNLVSSGHKVSLIGTSAGASAVINAYGARTSKIYKVVCICGKLRNPQTVGSNRLIENPAFGDSLKMLTKSLELLTDDDRSKILSLRPLVDKVVPPADSRIDGAHNRLLLAFGHSASIAYALTIGSSRIARFIKR